jgi:hypothetical protein
MPKEYRTVIEFTGQLAEPIFEPEKVALMCHVPGETEPRIVDCLLEYTPDAEPHPSGQRWARGPNDSGLVTINGKV